MSEKESVNVRHQANMAHIKQDRHYLWINKVWWKLPPYKFIYISLVSVQKPSRLNTQRVVVGRQRSNSKGKKLEFPSELLTTWK